MGNLVHDLIKIQYIRQGYLPNVPYHLISDDEMVDAFLSGYVLKDDADEYQIDDTTYPNLHGYFIDMYPRPDGELRSAYYALVNSILASIEYRANGIGDVNLDGIVNFADVVLMRKAMAGIEILTTQQEKQADLNKDGLITLKDVLLLRRLIQYHHAGDYVLTEIIAPDWVYSYMLGIPVCDKSILQDKHNFLVLLGADNTYDIFDDEAMIKCYNQSNKYLKKNNIDRPPTIFGEPHVIKALRLDEVTP